VTALFFAAITLRHSDEVPVPESAPT
jgi:hypothetical protein